MVTMKRAIVNKFRLFYVEMTQKVWLEDFVEIEKEK